MVSDEDQWREGDVAQSRMTTSRDNLYLRQKYNQASMGCCNKNTSLFFISISALVGLKFAIQKHLYVRRSSLSHATSHLQHNNTNTSHFAFIRQVLLINPSRDRRCTVVIDVVVKLAVTSAILQLFKE